MAQSPAAQQQYMSSSHVFTKPTSSSFMYNVAGGEGTLGCPLEVVANHFDITMANTGTLYVYKVVLEMIASDIGLKTSNIIFKSRKNFSAYVLLSFTSNLDDLRKQFLDEHQLFHNVHEVWPLFFYEERIFISHSILSGRSE